MDQASPEWFFQQCDIPVFVTPCGRMITVLIDDHDDFIAMKQDEKGNWICSYSGLDNEEFVTDSHHAGSSWMDAVQWCICKYLRVMEGNRKSLDICYQI